MGASMAGSVVNGANGSRAAASGSPASSGPIELDQRQGQPRRLRRGDARRHQRAFQRLEAPGQVRQLAILGGDGGLCGLQASGQRLKRRGLCRQRVEPLGQVGQLAILRRRGRLGGLQVRGERLEARNLGGQRVDAGTLLGQRQGHAARGLAQLTQALVQAGTRGFRSGALIGQRIAQIGEIVAQRLGLVAQRRKVGLGRRPLLQRGKLLAESGRVRAKLGGEAFERADATRQDRVRPLEHARGVDGQADQDGSDGAADGSGQRRETQAGTAGGRLGGRHRLVASHLGGHGVRRLVPGEPRLVLPASRHEAPSPSWRPGSARLTHHPISAITFTWGHQGYRPVPFGRARRRYAAPASAGFLRPRQRPG